MEAETRPVLSKSLVSVYILLTATVALAVVLAISFSPTPTRPAIPARGQALASAENVQTMKNPAAVYCLDLGYGYRIVTGPKGGQSGLCILPDATECPDWDFLNGLCGQDYSICALNGLDTVTLSDGKNPFSRQYAVCADASGKVVETVADMADLKNRARGQASDVPRDVPLPSAVPAADSGPADASLPASFDWRNQNGSDWMTPVKDQGQCGSCWAFSAVGVSEAVLNIGANNPDLDLDLSEQYLVTDCCLSGGNCTGGYKGVALAYIRDSGVPDEGCLPYGDGEGCTFIGISCSTICTYRTGGQCSDYRCSDRCSDWASRLARITSSTYLGYNPTKDTMKQALIDHGPLAVSMNMEGSPQNGIYTCPSNTETGHAVIIVGYDDPAGYWIVKNSWGETWGPDGDGYFKVAYDNCAIQKYPYYADAVQPVVINELDPGGVDWVEIHNSGSQPVTMDGWHFIAYNFAGSVDVDYTFPEFTLPPGGYVTLREGSGPDSSTELYLEAYITWVNNGSGAGALTNGSTGVDFVRFGSSSVAPPAGTGWTGSNPQGPPADWTLGRDPASTDTDAGDDWCIEPPTGGSQNAECEVCYGLGISIDPSGGGSVDPRPGPNCGSQYLPGTQVELTADANQGYNFDQWSGDASGSANPTTVTMDGARSVTAHFEPVCFDLSVSVNPGGSGIIDASPPPGCGSLYAAGTVVTLTADALTGFSFDYWSGDASGSGNPITITMNEARSVTANFEQVCYSLSTDVSPAGSGSVGTSPPPGCGDQYDPGTTVTLTAQANAGFAFSHWVGDASGSANPTRFTMDANRSATAVFKDVSTSILLVDDDDNEPDVRSYYEDALDALGAAYDVWDTGNSDDEPDAGTLGNYSTVIWFSGAEYGGFAGPGAAGETALSAYLDDGHCLLISSQDYYYDRELTGLMAAYLGVASVSDDEGQTIVSGQGTVFGGLGPYTLVHVFADYSDVITPDGTAELAFIGTQGGAALSKDNGLYRATYWGFPLEALPGAADRSVAVGTFLDWCGLERRHQVVINEIDVGDPDWIELYNGGDAAADLTGWRLQAYLDGSLYSTYTFPEFALQPDSYVVLHEGSGTDSESDLYSGGDTLPWVNEESGAAALTSDSGDGIDFVRWGDSAVPPPPETVWTGDNPGAFAAGESLGRGTASTDNDDGADWCSQAPSPGAKNMGCIICSLPGTPELLAPEHGATTRDNTPSFEWGPAAESTRYQIQIDDGSDWSKPEVSATVVVTGYTPVSGLPDGTYQWRVRGHNGDQGCDLSGAWSISRTVSIDAIFDVVANWTSSAPEVDGQISTGEWDFAARYDITADAAQDLGRNASNLGLPVVVWSQGQRQRRSSATSPVTLYVANDATHLYLAIDNAGDGTQNPEDQMGVYFDDNPLPSDGQWTSTDCGNPDGEGNLWLAEGTVTYREWVSGPASCEPISPAPGATGSLGYGAGHAQAELAIDLRTSALRASAGEAISMYLWLYDGGTGSFAGEWPADADFEKPSTYRTLTLAAGAGLQTPELVSPPNGARVPDARPVFDWTSVSGATLYRLQVDDDPGFGLPEMDATSTSSDLIPDLPLPLGTWTWRVQALNESESSFWSSSWTLVITAQDYLPLVFKGDR